MKKILATVLAVTLAAGALAGCGGKAQDGGTAATTTAAGGSGAAAGTEAQTTAAGGDGGKTGADAATAATTAAATTAAGKTGKTELQKLVVGASPSPHAEILAQAKDLLAEKGFALEIKEYNDYVQPNVALEAGDLDANYFQHKPYMDDFNAEKKTDLVSAGAVHYEPFGIYAGKTESLMELADGAKVAVPNDSTNEARALLLLESVGLVKVKEGVGLKATKQDIIDNPKKLDIIEMEAAQLPRSIQDVDLAIINGNYAIPAGLKVSDALAVEDSESVGATTFGNVIAVKNGRESDEAVKALVEALQSDEIKKFIEEKYQGAVVPLF